MASLANLLIQETKAAIYARGLAVATALGLPVTSWVAGDPTRSLYYYLAEVLSTLEVMVAGYVSSGFLDYATADWLTILADQSFNVQRIDATFAGTPVTLTNGGGGIYVIAPGDVVVKSSTNGKTYTNTSGGTLGSSPHTLTLDFTADESGSASTAFAGQIDTLVTGLISVTCSNAAAALGLDAEPDQALRDRCRAKLGTLSPNGPADAYNFIVRDSTRISIPLEITKSRTISDSTTGNVTVYVGGASGAVSGAAVIAAQSAVQQWSSPLCITPTVVNCVSLPVAVTYEIWLYAAVGETDAAITSKVYNDLLTMFAARPIGGDIIAPATTGALYQSLISATIRASYPTTAFRVAVTAPAGDTALAINQIAQLGTVTGTTHIQVNP